jgi:mannose-1-phosphate guanylyltransferase
MKAVVLVGGFGTRLRPLTFTTPKPLLPIGRVPMLTRIVHQLAKAGVDEVVLALGFRTEAFTVAYPGDLCDGTRLICATEPEPLDTAGAIAFAARAAGIDDTFAVFNGDIVCDLDVAALVDAHRRHGASATVYLTRVADPSAYGVADLDGDRIAKFVEKPAAGTAPSDLINGGVYVLEPRVLDLIPATGKYSIERRVFPELAAAGDLFGFASDVYWLDTGTPATLLEANIDLVTGARPALQVPMIPADATVGDNVTVIRSVIGDGATLQSGAVIENSVLLGGVRVGAGSTVSGSLVGRGAWIGPHAVVDDTLLGDGAIVGADEQLHGARRPAV